MTIAHDARDNEGIWMEKETGTRSAAAPGVNRWLGFVARKRAPSERQELFYRHTVTVRTLHWVNALCLLVMLMSGLQIFNAHPALYWGNFSSFSHPFIALMSAQDNAGHISGVTQIGPWQFNTTGFLGASYENGQLTVRGFPAWATLPSSQWLAMGRLWHFFFAWIFVINGLAFVIYAFARRHVQNDLLPKRADIRHLGREIADHVRLRFPKGEAAKRYNALQKIAYFAVIFGLGPVVVLTGLTMAPTIDSAFPWLVWIFGGRQSARTIHFICAFSFLGFFIIHIVMVVLSGTWNNLRSMITGWYGIDREDRETSHV